MTATQACRPASADVSTRIATWRELLGRGDDDALERRLAWDGLAPEAAEHIAASGRWRGADSAPGASWRAFFRTAYGVSERDMAARFAPLGDAADRATDLARPLPFEELYIPLVMAARARVRAAAGEAYALFDDHAHGALERLLLAQLARIGGRMLFAEFAVFRVCAQAAGLRTLLAAAGDGGAPSRAVYDRFLAYTRGGRLFGIFDEYPVAARLCATAAELWSDATVELLERVRDDLPELQRTFGVDTGPDAVAGVQGGLSDAHNGGRSVMILTFRGGTRIVYKPRPIGIEGRFGQLLAWLDAHVALRSLRRLRVVCRPTHGWIEFAERTPCATPEQVARFYERCGMLLALAYALNGTDFHLENLLACGEDPVLLDLETLLGHHFDLERQVSGAHPGASEAARRALDSSVLRVYMLPAIKVSNEGWAAETGALAASQPTDGEPARALSWQHVNTDAMRLVMAPVPRQTAGNLPTLKGEPVAAPGHVAQIVHGFQHTYRLLAAHRHELLAPGGAIDGMGAEPVRFIFRHTNLYFTLLERLLHPKYLHDEADRAIQIDVLARPLLALGRRPALWPLLGAEREALEQLDIPFFAAPAGSRSLVLPSGEVVADCFDDTAVSEARRRLEGLDERDLERQTELIGASFAAAAARDVAASAESSPRSGSLIGEDVPGVSLAAADIADIIRRRSDGRLAGALGIGYLPQARRYAVAPIACNLFDGYLGVALFLAALERTTRDGTHRALVRGAIDAAGERLPELARAARQRSVVDIGAGTGLASAAYALVRIATLLGEEQALDHAQRIGALITTEVIARDHAYDVISGAAGAALGLLALYEATGDERALERAAACAAHLLAARTRDDETGQLVWRTRHGHAERGFAHGAAGIALALHRVADATNDDGLRVAAAEAIAHERWMARAGADPDDEALAAWGRGGVGIALARLGAAASGDALDADTRAEIDAGIRSARNLLLDGADTLCAGTCGRIELLLYAARRLGRHDLTTLARSATERLIARGSACGYRTGWAHGYEHLGLFQGLAGIGYELLRVAHADELPSLSLLE